MDTSTSNPLHPNRRKLREAIALALNYAPMTATELARGLRATRTRVRRELEYMELTERPYQASVRGVDERPASKRGKSCRRYTLTPRGEAMVAFQYDRARCYRVQMEGAWTGTL